MTSDSDIDVLVISDDKLRGLNDHLRLQSAMRGVGTAVDVFLISPSKFEQTKDVFGGIAYPANKYGRVVYDAA